MAVPNQGVPDSSVNPGGDFELAQSFQTLVTGISNLTQIIQNQTSVLERTASASARYSGAGVSGQHAQPQITDEAMSRIRQYARCRACRAGLPR